MKIDKDIPIPTGPNSGSGEFAVTARAMEVGDSVGDLCIKERTNLTNALKTVHKNESGTRCFRSRTQLDGTHRVWRIA